MSNRVKYLHIEPASGVNIKHQRAWRFDKIDLVWYCSYKYPIGDDNFITQFEYKLVLITTIELSL